MLYVRFPHYYWLGSDAEHNIEKSSGRHNGHQNDPLIHNQQQEQLGKSPQRVPLPRFTRSQPQEEGCYQLVMLWLKFKINKKTDDLETVILQGRCLRHERTKAWAESSPDSNDPAPAATGRTPPSSKEGSHPIPEANDGSGPSSVLEYADLLHGRSGDQVADVTLCKVRYSSQGDDNSHFAIAKAHEAVVQCAVRLGWSALLDISRPPDPNLSVNYSIVKFRHYSEAQPEILLEERIFKYFSLSETSRKMAINLELMPNARIEASWAGGEKHIISYAFISGKPFARNVAQALYVAKFLLSLHEKGVWHGDVRGYNIVFADLPQQSRLIDFDFACKTEPGKVCTYSERLNRDIHDAQRHEGAFPKAPMAAEHDLFSLYHVFLKHSPKQNVPYFPWLSWVGILGSGSSSCQSSWPTTMTLWEFIQVLESFGASRDLESLLLDCAYEPDSHE